MPATYTTVPTRRSGARADRTLEWWIGWILRCAAAGTFIGHGAFGVKGKEAWLDYYALFGISPGLGWDLMPLTGAVDITMGILVLLVPMRSVLLYMAVWGLFTASLRPLAGQGGFELVERSYNFGPALALLLLHGRPRSLRDWFSPLRTVPRLRREQARTLAFGLRVVIAAYLIGHGALAVVMDKPLLLDLYGSAGLGAAATLNDVAGSFEIGLGLLLLSPRAATTPVLLCVAAWKLGSESLYIANGSIGAGWEVVERAGAYATPLALIGLNAIVRRESRDAAAQAGRRRRRSDRRPRRAPRLPHRPAASPGRPRS
jgi:uncharacterized membrane protein YphA (DoxX/SURF4 family)